MTEAIPGAEVTSVIDETLWNAARSAPALQNGTITYIFKLKLDAKSCHLCPRLL